jgi:hypothetical protein
VPAEEAPPLPTQDIVEVPEPPVILLVERLQWKLEPETNDELVDRATLSVKPPEGVTVIVEVPATPAFTVTLVGLADIAKSPTAWTG